MGALEIIVVALIVSFCMVFSVWRLMPTKHRLRLLHALASKAGSGSGNGWLARLERTARADLARSSCGQCSANAVPMNRARALGQHRRPAAPHRS
jgi:hypothetical protein